MAVRARVSAVYPVCPIPLVLLGVTRKNSSFLHRLGYFFFDFKGGKEARSMSSRFCTHVMWGSVRLWKDSGVC